MVGCAILSRDGEQVELKRWQADLVMEAMCHRIVTTERVVELIWPDPDNEPDFWLEGLKTRVWRLRYITRRFGFEVIGTPWHGYSLRFND